MQRPWYALRHGPNGFEDLVPVPDFDSRWRIRIPKDHDIGPDGKTLVEKKEMKGVTVWRIEGLPPPPWATVNSAIRYVLEMRNKTTNPAIKKNADQTLSELLRLE